MKIRCFVLLVVTLLASACGKPSEPSRAPIVTLTSEQAPTLTSQARMTATSAASSTPVRATATSILITETLTRSTETPAARATAQPTATAPVTAAPTIEDGEFEGLRITILYDNVALEPPLRSDWGFGALIQYRGQTVLFDTGAQSALLLDNMALLGIDPHSIAAVVLSHYHGDHIGGMQGMIQAGTQPKVYVLPSFPSEFGVQFGPYLDLIQVAPGQAVADGVYTTGELSGGPALEQALIIETGDGLVLVTGCAHPGIVKMVEWAQERFGDQIRLVVGGFHLVDQSPSQVKAILDEFRRLGVEQVAPAHCTGEEAIAIFAEAYGDNYVQAGVGRVISVPVSQVQSAATPSAPVAADPFALISQDSLFAYLEDLTAFQSYSGWRNSATEGEAAALDYVAATLRGFRHLEHLGLELERQQFRVFLATELWETRLHLSVNDQMVEVPADGLRGPRDDIAQALRFDSDGALNDTMRNPVVVEGPVVVVRSAEEIHALRRSDVGGKILLLDYAAVDRILVGTEEAAALASELIAKEPAGLVLVTQFSNAQNESHGFGVGDVSALNWVTTDSIPPILYARLEDLTPAGIAAWDDLDGVDAARLTWDADVFSPGSSGNLIARIPGVDSSAAIILGAHIDSPNSPGAMDDGSGSVALLEVGRVIDQSMVQPPFDLYLVWFGSEELGLYGASHFILTHQELLDRALAMLQIDNLTHPLDGIDAKLNLVTWSHSRFGDSRLVWPDALGQLAAQRGVETTSQDYHAMYSDNTPFGGFGVPNADLIYADEAAMEAAGGFHYAAHVHDPYDTIVLAREEGHVLEQMARVTLAAALDVGSDHRTLRVAPVAEGRALFVGTHTESVHMAPTSFVELGMALAWEGLDVDLVPYGQTVNGTDLNPSAVDLVVVLPILDYPGPEADPTLYDEEWGEAEIEALAAYVQQGGLLVLTNSAHRLKYGNRVLDPNEDGQDINALATRFGVTFLNETLRGTRAWPVAAHALMNDVDRLELAEDNSLRFTMSQGQVLAETNGHAIVGLVASGDQRGEVLVLADVGLLGASWGDPINLTFWQNLARYARTR